MSDPSNKSAKAPKAKPLFAQIREEGRERPYFVRLIGPSHRLTGRGPSPDKVFRQLFQRKPPARD